MRARKADRVGSLTSDVTRQSSFPPVSEAEAAELRKLLGMHDDPPKRLTRRKRRPQLVQHAEPAGTT